VEERDTPGGAWESFVRGDIAVMRVRARAGNVTGGRTYGYDKRADHVEQEARTA